MDQNGSVDLRDAVLAMQDLAKDTHAKSLPQLEKKDHASFTRAVHVLEAVSGMKPMLKGDASKKNVTPHAILALMSSPLFYQEMIKTGYQPDASPGFQSVITGPAVPPPQAA